MSRVVAYIDGFNLYYGLRESRLRRYYWLDLVKLMGTLLKPDQALEHTRYFTARIKLQGRNAPDVQRQATYLDALATLPSFSIQEGHFLAKEASCKRCTASWTKYEEKMSDVNLAMALLLDAVDDRFDTAILVSGDSDLTTPIRHVRDRFPQKRVVIAFPPNRNSYDLKRAAHGHLSIGEDKLRKSLLPDIVTTPTGVELHRPSTWR